jgi:hypothetical protein
VPKTLKVPVAITTVAATGLLLWSLTARLGAGPVAFLNVFTPFVLLVMGVAVTMYDTWPKRHPRLTVAAFVAVGAFAMFVAYRQSVISGQESAELANQISGGNSYCVFLADLSQSSFTGGVREYSGQQYASYDITVEVHGKYSMSNVTAEYRSNNAPTLYPDSPYSLADNATFHPGGKLYVGSMAFGLYEIKVYSRNGMLNETLEIGVTDNKAWQVAVIRRDGKTIYTFDSRRQ